MKTVIEVSIDGLNYDNGYGGVDATLVCDVDVETQGTRTYVNVVSGTWFLIDQDGGDAGEREYCCGTHDEHLQDLALAQFEKLGDA